MHKWEAWMDGFSDSQQFVGDRLPRLIGTAEAETYDEACEIIAAKWNKTAEYGHKMVRRNKEQRSNYSDWGIWGIKVHCAWATNRRRVKKGKRYRPRVLKKVRAEIGARVTDASPEGVLRIDAFYHHETQIGGVYYDTLRINNRLETFRQDETIILGIWITATQDGGLAYQARKMNPDAVSELVAVTMGDESVNKLREGAPKIGLRFTQLFGRKQSLPIVGKN